MGSVVELYEALASAPDERARVRLIAAAFERLEERYPRLPDLVTHQQLGETELRLRKAIEQIRGHLIMSAGQSCREAGPGLEPPRGDLRETFEGMRAAFEHFGVDITAAIKHDRNILLMWIITIMIAQVGVFAALVKLL